MLAATSSWAAEEEAVTLGRVIEVLNELVEKGVSKEAEVAEFTLDLEGVEETYLLRSPEPGEPAVLERLDAANRSAVTLALIIGQGACSDVPVNWRLVRDFGLYVIEFCDHALIPSAAHGDFHRRGNGSGGLGGYMQTLDFRCDVYSEYAAMTNLARSRFC